MTTESYRQASVETIAQEMLGIPTLKTRGSDRLDFHTISVWELERALELAFIRGQQRATDDIKTMMKL